MNIIAFVGAGVIGAVLSVVLKQYRPEFSIYISLVTGMIMLGALILLLSPVIESVLQLSELSANGFKYSELLLKSLAICYITQLASESCRDAGESSIATKIDFAGRCAILLLSMPLFTELINIVKGLME
ncbi:MAG: stage III sporulation protein AC/AD protein family [Ruminiclostridium sp.]|nr:stage III sporulation protein AC/AD protein family [Ruminiclostridium sp.]MBQ8931048.1 stage III sporulation protein AC/AD protein family [Ruminiclostridium sp.]